METYRVGGNFIAGLINANVFAGVLWNPSSDIPLEVTECNVSSLANSTSGIALQRTTTRGTPGSTVTPTIDSAVARTAAPPSGAVFDLPAFAVAPTASGPVLDQWNFDNVVGAAKLFRFFPSLIVPGGQGLGIFAVLSAASVTYSMTFVWTE